MLLPSTILMGMCSVFSDQCTATSIWNESRQSIGKLHIEPTTVEAFISGHPQNMKKVSVTEAGHLWEMVLVSAWSLEV